jgi:hypothetical protein
MAAMQWAPFQIEYDIQRGKEFEEARLEKLGAHISVMDKKRRRIEMARKERKYK